MRLWSRGLGRLVLPLDLGNACVDLTPDDVVLSGTIREGKVIWPYTVKMNERDFLGFTTLAVDPDVLHFLARRHGLGLVRTIAVRTVGFAWGLVRKGVGLGTPVVPEETLAVGPRAAKPARRGGNGVLVQGSR
jgi:hypothetical protein